MEDKKVTKKRKVNDELVGTFEGSGEAFEGGGENGS
jgi:hypothetical protein